LSLSRGSRLGVGVLDTREGYPEISWHAIALLPVLVGDALVNIWLLDGGVLIGLLRGEASSVVGQLFEIPSVELVGGAKAIHGGPGNIEVLSDLVFVCSPLNLGISASRVCAIGTWAIDREVLDRSANQKGIIFWEVDEVGSAVIIHILVKIGSTGTNDGVHLVLQCSGANISSGNTTGVGIVNLNIGVSFFLLAILVNNGVFYWSTEGHAEVMSTSDARCAVKVGLKANGGLLILGQDARAEECSNSKSNLSCHF